MGVPALFRWLSKKYPKIIYPVIEEDEAKVDAEDGMEVLIPTNMAQPNPNGIEFDNLYLDMNGIVHPCTHPEGKPAPETEEDMMIEIFKYTERVVNMVRPRKLLVMAIDGVAPRAKMNQQRSRRFRAAQEAQEKEEARRESVALWESLGKTLPEEEKNKTSWDTNAITPGTPFMHLLALSLRYWVAQKMNTDPGWKNMQVILSDASVPGEGEHKIMDLIRRLRSSPGYDPNTKHVIYGLDADLIMLSLATHEPNFRVLREDVFAKDVSSSACRNCGQEGHYSAQCTNPKAEIKKASTDAKSPFIWLDVAVLREYLEVELDVTHAGFPFDFEQAIDDWVLLIFFVGNDFLPHLPSLEIREGAIDTLLRIWKQELPRMNGYLTNHGHLNLSRVQIILEGLAQREDEIFRRRRQAEERQDENKKRRKVEEQQKEFSSGPSAALGLTSQPSAPNPLHPSLPPKPDFAARADLMGFGGTPTSHSAENAASAAQAIAGSNKDIVANRRAIRMANMSAAEMLKAEMAGQNSNKSIPSLPPKPASVQSINGPPSASLDASPMNDGQPQGKPLDDADGRSASPNAVNGGSHDEVMTDVEGTAAGKKRKFDEGPAGEFDDDAEGDEILPDDDEPPPEDALALKVNADGTVEQEDTVKLWEPGYKERYYRSKFGIELSDTEARRKITQSYVEGMAWVLHYYYHGTPSWHWFYPYHFAPFASDFLDVDKMKIRFNLGEPAKPYEQLMSVFPSASKIHLPPPFHPLMEEEDSPIIDFYPKTFQVDMNGKKMAWQGVALLPFIDSNRLMDAMIEPYTKLTDEENSRNRLGTNVVYTSTEHPIYPFYEQLYGKKKSVEPAPVSCAQGKGLSGSVLPNPNYVPGSTFYSPLLKLPDIKNDQSLSALYFYPKQLTPHQSVLLPGAKQPPRALSGQDLEQIRNRGRGRGSYDNRNTGRSVYGMGRGRGRMDERNGQYPYQGYNPPPNAYHQSSRQSYPPSDYRRQQDHGYGGRPPANNYSSYGGHGRYDQYSGRGGDGGYGGYENYGGRGGYNNGGSDGRFSSYNGSSGMVGGNSRATPYGSYGGYGVSEPYSAGQPGRGIGGYRGYSAQTNSLNYRGAGRGW